MSLSPDEKERYAWQLDISGHGETGQERLKSASVLITRCGGVGGTVALELAAAGVGHLILAHGGDLRLDDLNRQLLMTTEHVGKPRIESAARRIRELNPNVKITAIGENVSPENAAKLVEMADVVVDAAPLFSERFALNTACVVARKPLVEAAMFAMEFTLTTILPGVTPCLVCIYPENPAWWTRRFPVFGAVSGTVGCLAAAEVIKLVSGFGKLLAGEMLRGDLGENRYRKARIFRDVKCPVCSAINAG
jgi:molybdopterin/thiamine biosynthesis adenylyltransferase